MFDMIGRVHANPSNSVFVASRSFAAKRPSAFNLLTFNVFLALCALAPVAARAGFTATNWVNRTATTTLTNNTVYVVSDNFRVTANGGNAFKVAEGATAVLYIQKGATLTANGGNASGTTAAGAGIYVPFSSTLIVTGGGTLVATGGSAANGDNGGNGGAGHQYYADGTPGRGGDGGSGGGGAAAGIGGNGGNGGAAGLQQSSPEKLTTTWGEYDREGAGGDDGGNGGTAGSSGTIYFLGTVSVTAEGGAGGSGGSQGSAGSGDYEDYSRSWRVGGGGAGGGGGGAGGNGGSYETTPSTYTYYMPNGGNGGGGSSNGGGSRSEGQYTSYTGNDSAGKRGGHGGYGGSAGSNGSSGSLYRDSSVAISGTYYIATPTNSHSAIEYKLAFLDAQRVNVTNDVRLGYSLPTAPAVPARSSWIFNGWFTGANGTGTKYYNADGSPARDDYDIVGDLTLYASWMFVDASTVDTISVNGVGLTAGVSLSGEGWSYDGDTGYVTLSSASIRYVVTGKDTAGEFSLYPTADCTIVMSNLTINASANVSDPPLEVATGKSVTLLFEGENYVYGPANYPAIYVSEGSTLTIGECSGKVTATGGANAPGIGGKTGETHGTGKLNIQGGDIEAVGGENAASIGAAESAGFGMVAISGGTVRAVGGKNGAGIGSSRFSDGTICNISGGTVTAYGGDYGAGIGGGLSSVSNTVVISGGNVIANAGRYGAGIGGGKSCNSEVVEISGGTVTATGSNCGAGIGLGLDGAGFSVEISGGSVTAYGGSNSSAAGIGGGYGSTNGSVRISGGTVGATGGRYGAGIGAGDAGSKDTETGITVEISGGVVTASSPSAAAIGPGDYTLCGTVSISGGTIYASTGESSAKAIGKSRYCTAASVTIHGGAVYSDLDDISPAPTNSSSNAVFPVDFDIGEATSHVASLTLYGALSSYSYGTTDLYTDANGNLRIWFPSTSGSAFVAKVVMESGEEYFFSFIIDDDGGLTEAGYLIVDGSVVSSDADYVGTGWSYTKSTCELKLTGNVYVQGLSTNGDFRIVVPSGGASSVSLKKLTLTAPATKYASSMVISNDCALTFSGTNTLTAIGNYAAGIEVVSNATLTISSSSGSLSAIGGKYGAGIGSRGSGFANPGRIVIESGTISAQGGEKAAGIGGGQMCNLQENNIVVSGGVVTATGGASAAGIGSGYVGSVSGNKMIPAGAVKITGGSIHAVCGSAPQTNIGDLIMSANANQIAGGDTALTITGGSVVGENGVVIPCPVNGDGVTLAGIVVSNLEAGAEITVAGLPSYYGVNDIVADENGVICLWLPANDKDDETDCYTFTAGGSTWKVRIEKTGFFRGIAVVPEKLRIGAFNVSRSGLRFTVSADDAQWLHLNAASLRIRVASSPAMTEENSKLLVPEVVENGDGTVTLEVAPDATPSGGSGFFKIEQ